MTESEIVAGGRDSLVDKEDPRLSDALKQRALNGNFKGELNFKRKDGTRFPVEISTGVYKDRRGNERTCIIARDITERKQAEKALRESEERFKEWFESSPISLWEQDFSAIKKRLDEIKSQNVGDLNSYFRQRPELVWELAGMVRVLDVNQATLKLYRAKSNEELFGGITKVFSRESLEGFLPVLEVIAAGEKTFVTEKEHLTLDGEPLKVQLYWAVAKGHEETYSRVLVSIVDITQVRQAEQEREKLQSQLQQSQKIESVGRLAGGVAHDFNNKLSVINGYAELAMETIDPSDPLHETIQEIHTAGKESAEIVRQLLAFARKQTINPVLLDLNDTISGMLKMLQRLIGENIDLEWHPGKNLWPVKIDPSQVDQIMANLAVNSRDAISDVGKLTIETDNIMVDEDYCRGNPEAIPGQYVMLAVSDDGCGIEEEIKKQLFDPYFTTKEVGKGTGLGLATIYGIVKQNKGFINVYSEPGEGTTFKLYFPSHEETKPSLYPAKESTGQNPKGTETVLVVEDEKTILQMSRQMLERLGYIVETAGSASEALQVSKEYDGAIDLLITDVIMPDMNGRDLSSQLLKSHPALKTLYMSGYTANVIAHHGVLDEGVQFIQKPFSLRDLATKVREVLG